MTHRPLADPDRCLDPEARAARIQAEILRGMPASRRLAICVEWTRIGVESSRRALARARPDLEGEALILEWARLHYGAVPGRHPRGG